MICQPKASLKIRRSAQPSLIVPQRHPAEAHLAARIDRFGSHSDQPRPKRHRRCDGDVLDQPVEIAEVNGASSSSLLPRSDNALLSAVLPTTNCRDRRLNLNGGWSADPRRNRSRRGLSHTRYDNMAEASSSSLRRSAHRSSGLRTVDERRAALVKMQTDYRATPAQCGILRWQMVCRIMYASCHCG
jgi:hypothetical protein